MPSYTSQDIYEFIQEHPFATLATVNAKHQPYAATILCIAHTDGHLFFLTRVDSQKYKNIQHNPSCALVVTHPHDPITLQMHGVAKEVPDTHTQAQIINEFVTLSGHQAGNLAHWLPPLKRLSGGQFTVVRVQLTWARISDFRDPESPHEEFIHEVTI